MAKKWIFPPERTDDVRRLTDALRVSITTARLLVNRGITDPMAAQRFLQPNLHDLVDPEGHAGLREAARFILDAVSQHKRITVYGDYDADGICAAALLQLCLDYLDAEADLYIPHRVDEGYGLSCEAIDEIADSGAQVVITVDCGITAVDEVARARQHGMEIVVTDHHPPKNELPDTPHLLDPKLSACGFGYEFLAGVGVAFKLMWALGQEVSPGRRVSEEFRELLVEALSLVALGTVADVVPLLDENRTLVYYGLRTLSTTGRPGLKALMASARVTPEYVDARDIGYRLAPRLNAAGRMGHAGAAVELLVTSDAEHAAELAEHLDSENRRRRSEQNATCREAEAALLESDQLEEPGCIVLSSPEWHQGILGLVASRLCEEFWRPAFIFAESGGVLRGSARSVPGFALHLALQQCHDLLERFGGHAGAAGLTLPRENLEVFAEQINEMAHDALGKERPTPELSLDGQVRLGELSLDLLHELNTLGPFGQGNEKPMVAASGLKLAGNPRIVGSGGDHLTFMVRQDDTTLRTIAMGKADWAPEMRERKGEAFSLAFEPIINRYRGRVSVELRVEDMQWDEERCVETRPSR